MVKKTQRGLGRGLGAIWGEEAQEEIRQDKRDVVELLPITSVDPNLDQPRKTFDEAALEELAQSVRSVGVLQPIIVAKNGERYTIIAGERRFRAARLAQLNEIPAIVRDWDAQKRMEAALIENLQRDDLNPIEEAEGVRRLMDEANYTQEEISKRLGKSRSAVANLLRLLKLPDAVRTLVLEGKLSAGHARALAGLDDAQKQIMLANLCVQSGWSVRQLEAICAKNADAPAPEKPAQKRNPQLKTLEGMARSFFGTKVRLDGDENKGKLTLYYYNADDLQRIWDVLEQDQEGL